MAIATPAIFQNRRLPGLRRCEADDTYTSCLLPVAWLRYRTGANDAGEMCVPGAPGGGRPLSTAAGFASS